MIRKPYVAGHFYPLSDSELSDTVARYIEDIPEAEKVNAVGLVSPHAGLIYSGAVAGAVFSRVKVQGTLIILSPNHTGLGRPVSVMSSGIWQVPNGSLEIDEPLAESILSSLDIAEKDETAHLQEHSIEVQLPFILHFSSDVKIVPITIMAGSLEICRMIGDALAEVISKTDHPVTIIASSDMSHYEEDAVARKKDKMAINRIIELNDEGLHNTVKAENISMCGFAPVTAMLHAAVKLGAREASLIKYSTSGEISGDYSQVVGYAGVIVK